VVVPIFTSSSITLVHANLGEDDAVDDFADNISNGVNELADNNPLSTVGDNWHEVGDWVDGPEDNEDPTDQFHFILRTVSLEVGLSVGEALKDDSKHDDVKNASNDSEADQRTNIFRIFVELTNVT